MIVPLGLITIGAIMPAPYGAVLASYADLQARVTALANFQVGIQPASFAAQLTLLASMVANINALIALGISPPSIQLQIDATLALLVELEAQLALILAIPFGVSLYAYVYTGPANAFGPEFTALLSGGFPAGNPLDDTLALVLATTSDAGKVALRAVFKTS